MSEDTNVTLSGSGPGETVLPEEAADWAAELDEATKLQGSARRQATAATALRHPRHLRAWAELAELAEEQEGSDEQACAYAFARVGYHRGLDALRAAGWRGSGYVRGSHESNRGFLRCLAALQRLAERIGEEDEAERCRIFLRQLDPDWQGR